MSTREVTLTGGSPWGFRMHGGSETGQPLRISRVNPGSKAAQKGVREGDVISSINGQPTRTLSNSDAHALLRNAGQSLRLGLNEDCGGSPKRRSYKMATSQSSSACMQSEFSRHDSAKRVSAPTGGESGGPTKESGEESKHPEKDRPSSRRRGGACRGRRNETPAAPTPAAVDDGPREETPTDAPEWMEDGPDSSPGPRTRKARKGVRERRRARMRAAATSGGEASEKEGCEGRRSGGEAGAASPPLTTEEGVGGNERPTSLDAVMEGNIQDVGRSTAGGNISGEEECGLLDSSTSVVPGGAPGKDFPRSEACKGTGQTSPNDGAITNDIVDSAPADVVKRMETDCRVETRDLRPLEVENKVEEQGEGDDWTEVGRGGKEKRRTKEGGKEAPKTAGDEVDERPIRVGEGDSEVIVEEGSKVEKSREGRRRRRKGADAESDGRKLERGNEKTRSATGQLVEGTPIGEGGAKATAAESQGDIMGGGEEIEAPRTTAVPIANGITVESKVVDAGEDRNEHPSKAQLVKITSPDSCDGGGAASEISIVGEKPEEGFTRVGRRRRRREANREAPVAVSDLMEAKAAVVCHSEVAEQDLVSARCQESALPACKTSGNCSKEGIEESKVQSEDSGLENSSCQSMIESCEKTAVHCGVLSQPLEGEDPKCDSLQGCSPHISGKDETEKASSGVSEFGSSDRFNGIVERVARCEFLCLEWKTVEEFCSSDCERSTEFEIVNVGRKESSHVTATAVTLLAPPEGSLKEEDSSPIVVEEVVTTGEEASTAEWSSVNEIKSSLDEEETIERRPVAIAEKDPKENDSEPDGATPKEILSWQEDFVPKSPAEIVDIDLHNGPPMIPCGDAHVHLCESQTLTVTGNAEGEDLCGSPVSPFALPPLPPPPFSPPSSRSSPVPFLPSPAIHPPFSGVLHAHKEIHPVTELPHLSSLPSSPTPCSTPPPSAFIPEEASVEPSQKQAPKEATQPIPIPRIPEVFLDLESSEEGPLMDLDTHCRSPSDCLRHSPPFVGEVSTTPPLPRNVPLTSPSISPIPDILSAVKLEGSGSSPLNNFRTAQDRFPEFSRSPKVAVTSSICDRVAGATGESDPNVLSGDSLSLEEARDPLPEMPEEAFIRRILRSMNLEEGEFRSRVIFSRSDAPSPSKTGRRRRPERRAGTFPPGSSRKPLEVIVEEEKHSGSGEESGGGSGGPVVGSSARRRRKKRIRRDSEGSGREAKTPEESSGEEAEYFPLVIEGLVRKVGTEVPVMQGPAEVVVVEEVEDAEEGQEWSEGWREEEFVDGEEEATEEKGVEVVVVETEEALTSPPLARRMSRELFMIPESDEEREEREQASVEGNADEAAGAVEAKTSPSRESVLPSGECVVGEGVTERPQVEECEGAEGGPVAGCKGEEAVQEEGGMVSESRAGRQTKTEEARVGQDAAEGGADSFRPSGGGEEAEISDLQNKRGVTPVVESPALDSATAVAQSESPACAAAGSSPPKEIPSAEKASGKEGISEEMETMEVSSSTLAGEITIADGRASVDLSYDVGESVSEDEEMLRTVEAALEDYSGGRESSLSPSTSASQCTEICKSVTRPESLVHMCAKAIAALPHGAAVLREIWSCTPPVLSERDRRRSPAPSPESRSEGEGRECEGRPGAGGARNSPFSSDTELDSEAGQPKVHPCGRRVDYYAGAGTNNLVEDSNRGLWVPIPTSADVNIGLSPKQLEAFNPDPSQAARLLDLHVKFLERRGYHEGAPKRGEGREEEARVVASRAQIHRSSPRPSPPHEGGREEGCGGGVEGSRLLPMLLGEGAEGEDCSRSGVRDSSHSAGGDSPRSLPATPSASPGMGLLPGEVGGAEGPSSPSSVGSGCGDERRLKARVLSEWLNLARSEGNSSGVFSPCSEGSPRSFCSPPPGGGGESPDSTEAPPSVRVCDVIRRFEMTAAASGLRSTKAPPVVRHSLYVESQGSYQGENGSGVVGGGGAAESPESKDVVPPGETVQKRQFDAEKYRISKQGDIAIEIAGSNEGTAAGPGPGSLGDSSRRQRRPVSMPPAVTGGEIFRQQMYMEYMHKVAERAERKQHKVIKLTARAGAEVGGQTQGPPPQPASTLPPTEELFVSEFMGKVRQRLERVGVAEDEEVEGVGGHPVGDTPADEEGPPQFTIEGGLTELPKHLREDTDLLLADDGSIALAPTFKATAVRPPGVWTPSKSTEDLRVKPSEEREKRASTKEVDSGSKEDVIPIWVPKSAGPSPTAERKEFRPVNFDASTLTRNKEGQSRSLASPSPAPEDSFAWQSKQQTESSKSVTVTSERHSFVQSPTSPGASFTSHLPKAQNPTITLLQKAREGQLPRGAHYLDDKEMMASKENDSDIMYTVRKEYETEDEKRKRKIVELAPKKFEGIGPTTKEGIPIILRSGIKEENQAKWYKKMYESLHCPGKDDEYVTVRYKTRRGRYPYTSAEGYLSEPDPIGYDSDLGYSAKYATLDRRRIKNKDYNFTTSTMPRSKYIPPSTKYGPEVYKNQPGRIEDYEPGHSSIADKEAKLWWDEVLDIFDGHANQTTPPSKPYMTHALKESGYESDSTLLFKRREENMQSLSPMEQKQAYKTIQMGGEVPLHGLRKPAPERPKEPVIGPVPIPKLGGTNQRDAGKESPHKYVESEVTIHYRSPIRAQAKEALPEEELARRQEEAMRRIYQEERRRKYLQELQDMESRRHTDNFTPSQKSPIPLNRYDNFLDDVPSKSKLRDHTPEPKVVARALYNFVGQTSRELSFRRGDIIFVRRQIDKNWYEGEHNAMIGLFPFNYVEIIPYDGIRTIPKRPTEGQARAKYNFVAQTHLELSLIKGELVVLTRQVDNNWFEGRIGNRRGIFPISYVEVLVEPGERPVTPSSKPTTMKPLTSPVSSSLLLNGSSVLSNTSHSQQPYHQQYLGKQQKQYQAPVSYSTQKTTTFTSSLGRNPYSSKTRSSAVQKLQIPSVNQTLHIDTHSDPVPYRALYNYKPQNEDELELQEGDTVYVMEKCDDGWYVGSSHRTGYFGTFPGNYVERI